MPFSWHGRNSVPPAALQCHSTCSIREINWNPFLKMECVDLLIRLSDVYEYLIMAVKIEKICQWKSLDNFSKLFGTCVVRFLVFLMPVFSPMEVKILGARIKNVFLVLIKKAPILSVTLLYFCVQCYGLPTCPHCVYCSHTWLFLPPLPVVDKPYYLRGRSCLCMQKVYVGLHFIFWNLLTSIH